MRRLTALSLLMLAAALGGGAAEPPKAASFFESYPILTQTHDGTIWSFSTANSASGTMVSARKSPDVGATWSEPENLFTIDPKSGALGLVLALADRDNELQLFFLNTPDASAVAADEAHRPKTGTLADRRLDIWHTRSRDGASIWDQPKLIWKGYTGALNSVIQLRSGRMLLPFSLATPRTWGNRGDGLDAFTFRGQFDSTLVYSDDSGDTWLESPARLSVPVPDIVSAYGAVEPVVLERKDGSVWMLIRTQQGRFYESFSANGIEWTTPRPSTIVSSDSPAGMVRTADGSIVLLWNNCLRFPYAYGGRSVLHAAISSDEGKTWRGYREVAQDARRVEPPPPTGDHGTAYPFPTALQDGRVIFVTGQGEGRVASILLEPDWLYETRQEERFVEGMQPQWSTFGTRGVELVAHPSKPDARALSIQRIDPAWPACAVWNFPAGRKGSVTVSADSTNLIIGLTDHFSTPFDQEDEFYNVFDVDLSTASIQPGNNASRAIRLTWDLDAGSGSVTVDEHAVQTLEPSRNSTGICYLRLHSPADRATGLNETAVDDRPCLIESVVADVSDSY